MNSGRKRLLSHLNGGRGRRRGPCPHHDGVGAEGGPCNSNTSSSYFSVHQLKIADEDATWNAVTLKVFKRDSPALKATRESILSSSSLLSMKSNFSLFWSGSVRAATAALVSCSFAQLRLRKWRTVRKVIKSFTEPLIFVRLIIRGFAFRSENIANAGVLIQLVDI